jgi:ssDNA-binding replication factor A large subunit
MLKIPYQDIVEKIQKQSGLSGEEIEKKINRKMEQLSGLISQEGAAHIIANELGVKLLDAPPTGPVQIKSIMPGMRSVETAGRVQQVYEVRSFSRNGREGRVGSFLLGDETGNIRVVLWNDQVSNMEGLKEGQVVKLVSAYSKDNRGRTELHINDKSKFVMNPIGVRIGETKAGREEAERKTIRELSDRDSNAEILGTIVQVFNLRFFEICPHCGRRAKPRGDDGFYCDEHAKVQPAYSYVLNIVVDDGTENVRTVLFRNQVDRLLGKSEQEISLYKDKPEEFESVKTELIGTMARFAGRVNKNEMFDRLEFVANLVFTDVNPEEEIRRLEKELAAKKAEMPKIDDI